MTRPRPLSLGIRFASTLLFLTFYCITTVLAQDPTTAASITASTSASAASASTSGTTEAPKQPASFKIIGVVLAVGSGLFIGSSFVFKKKGLLSAQAKSGDALGEGHSYLKSPLWWTGMTLMIIGEILNFVAYAFTEALLVTPLGALSVVVCAVLSSIFLKEKLTFFGKIGCLLAILGSVIIALNGPEEQSVTEILEFQKLFLAPGFLVYAGLVIVVSLGLIFYAVPKWGKTHMMVHISICSLIGGLSVATTQGLGASILTSIRGNNQFKHWFMYFLLGFVIITLLTEINYLNKALELFNTAMVTPTYYVMFTGCTMVTSVILYQGFKASVVDIITVVLGFIVICCGITLLQLSKVDPTTIATKLDRKSTILMTAAREDVHHDGDVEKVLDIDYADKISLHSPSSMGPARPGHLSPDVTGRERSSTLTFAPVETVHRYDTTPQKKSRTAGSERFASHEQRDVLDGAHVHSPLSADIGAAGQYPFRPGSTASIPSPIRDAGAYEYPPQPPGGYEDPFSAPSASERSQTVPRKSSGSSFLGDVMNAQFSSSSPDLLHSAGSPSSTAKSRFGIPKFPSPSGSRSNSAGRSGHHPSGPPDMDRTESERLVTRTEDSDSDGEPSAEPSADELGYRLSREESRL